MFWMVLDLSYLFPWNVTCYLILNPSYPVGLQAWQVVLFFAVAYLNLFNSS